MDGHTDGHLRPTLLGRRRGFDLINTFHIANLSHDGLHSLVLAGCMVIIQLSVTASLNCDTVCSQLDATVINKCAKSDRTRYKKKLK